MKKKLTLSIESATVALLRKASARRDTSISALIEEFAEGIRKEESERPLFSKEFPGLGQPVGADMVGEEGYHADQLRKSAAGQGALQARKKGRG